MGISDMIGMVIISLLVGFLVGFLIGVSVMRDKPVGDLRIDRSDPDDGPYLFLELKDDPNIISKKKQVVLHIKNESFVSQK